MKGVGGMPWHHESRSSSSLMLWVLIVVKVMKLPELCACMYE